MSETIDNRVVEMRFDNQQFESNIQTSLTSLEKLKQSLNLSGAAKGLDEVSNSTKGINMSGLGSAVDTVRARFSALQVMGVAALANIANSAVNAGKRLVESFALDPIKEGFGEYELKMGSIQTIMASTGENIDTVNKYLNELNEYSDKTIYSFSDMTQNIGKFTNAGVSLEKAVGAIKGVSNVAAISGANTNEASRSMYNFAQALAAGKVQAIDWKSIDLANMGTVEFKQQLIDTAVALGTVKKQGDQYVSTTKDLNGNVSDTFDSTNNFNKSLSSQWMTTKVLIQTLNQYATDVRDLSQEEKETYEKQLRKIGYTKEQIKSIEELGIKAADSAKDVKTFSQLMNTLKEAVGTGWADTFEIIFGNLEEAKSLWTGVSDVVGGYIKTVSDARNNMLKEWKELGGRTAIIDGLKNAFDGLVSVITPIGQAFREIFPPITGKQLFAFSKGFKEFTSHLKLSGTASENLKRTFKGLFAIFDIGKNVLTTVFNVIKSVFSLFDGAGEGILGVTAAWGDWLVSLDKTVNIGDTIARTIQNIVDSLKNMFSSVGNNVDFPAFKVFDAFLERFRKRIDSIKPAFSGASGTSDKFLAALEKIKSVLGEITGTVGKAFSSLLDKIANAKFSGLLDLINAVSIGGLSAGLMLVIKNFNKLIKGEKGTPLGDFIKGFTTMLGDFGRVGKSLSKSFDGVTKILDGVKDCLKAYQTQLKAGALIKIAGAIAILAGSIVVLSLIDSKKLAIAIGALTAMFADLMGAMAVFAKISGNIKNVVKTVTLMVGLSVAVLALSLALNKVSKLNLSELGVGLGGVFSLVTMMVAATKILGNSSKKILKGSVQIILFAVAMQMLANTLKNLSSMNTDELKTGLIGIGGLIAGLVIFLRTVKVNGKTLSSIIQIIVLANALKSMADVCSTLGAIKTEELTKGLTGIGMLLAEVGLFSKLVGGKAGILQIRKTGIAMLAIGKSMEYFSSAIISLSKLSWEGIFTGLTGIAGSLVAVGVAIKIMPKNLPIIGAGLLLVSNALIGISNSVLGFSALTWDEIARGLTALGGSLAILAVGLRFMNGTIAGALVLQSVPIALKPLIPVLSSLGNLSWDQVTHGLVALGGALAILSVGLHAMNGTIPGSVALLAASAALSLLAPALSILGNISWEGIGKGLIAIAGAFAIIGAAGLILAPVVPAILALSGAFVLLGVGFAGIGAGLIMAGVGLASIAAGLASLAVTTSTCSVAISEGITLIVTSFANLIPMIAVKVGEGIIAFAQTIAAGANVISAAILTVVTAVVNDMIKAAPIVVNGLFILLNTFLTTLQQYEPTLVQTGCDILVSFLNGIANNISRVVQAGIDIVLGVIDGIKQKLPDIIQAGFDLIIAYIDGLSKAIDENGPRLVDSMKNLILSAINAAVLVLTGGVVNFKSMGKQLMESGLVKGLKEKASAFGTKVKETVSNGVKAVRGKLSEWFSSGKAVIEKLVTGVKSKAKAFATEAKNTVTKALDAVKKKFKEWRDAGKSMVEKFIAGIKSKIDGVRRAASELVSRAKNALNKSGEARSAGANFGEGFKSGIMSVASRVADAARSLVSRAISAAKSAQKSASPSKVTRALGRYFGSGYILGIQDMRGKLVKSTETVFGKVIDATSGIIENGNSLLSGFGQTFLADTRDLTPATKTLNSVANAISELMNVIPEDTSPTIRPVLDLSAVKDGANSLNNLFASQYMIPAMANINGISSTMRSRNSGNTDVVEAIYSLKKELGKMGGVTNNIGDVTYDDGSNVSTAISALVRAIKMGRRG